jgi:CRISPR-associated protein Csb2
MALYIEQRFPLGRFHATRWNQGAFGDPYGEWPPSPWRLLRALANRWFQWSRETGNEDRRALDRLLSGLASELPEFYLPALTWRGEAIKQYVPAAVEEFYKYKSDPIMKKKVLDYQYRAVTKTLNEDHYRLVPPESLVLWSWPHLDASESVDLLDALLRRVLYFGRAEAWTRMSRIDALPDNPGEQCGLSERKTAQSVPVLAADPEKADQLATLFLPTEHEELRNREIPSCTRWYYTRLPARPRISIQTRRRQRFPNDLTHIQFAITGQVFPPLDRWCTVTGRFRGTVLRKLVERLTGNKKITYSNLPANVRVAIAGMSGKGADGTPLTDHSHAYFGVVPDDQGQPFRLVAWRRTPFSQEDIAALLDAAETPIKWDAATPKWAIRLLPLPFEMPMPRDMSGRSSRWVSLTPFVPPRQRRRYRENGKLRPGERPERVASSLCERVFGDHPEKVDIIGDMTWVFAHLSHSERRRNSRGRTPLPGYFLSLQFSHLVSGPLVIGDSSHFGLGLFVPTSDT